MVNLKLHIFKNVKKNVFPDFIFFVYNKKFYITSQKKHKQNFQFFKKSPPGKFYNKKHIKLFFGVLQKSDPAG